MSTTRRTFLRTATGLGVATLAGAASAQFPPDQRPRGLPAEIIDEDALPRRRPLVVSTWNHGLPANREAWSVLADGGRALDAVEAGVRVTEADPAVTTVGYGGLPDRDGHVTLDACVMTGDGDAGAVAFLEGIMHPVSVARMVMERTPHVMLAGEGARRFAREQGVPEQDLLTGEARRAWQDWLNDSGHRPWPPASGSNHDTISMLAIDVAGELAGACTTSGLAFKMHGRVGDSPIVGAALFVDGAVGAACATGAGEEVMKTVGSFLIVELMRQGASPQEACEEGIRRIVAPHPDLADLQVGYLAIDRRGRSGAYAIGPGFQYAVSDETGGTRLVEAGAHLRRE
jgi:N4-(beta-N-acetylglucosaminyl)-L-asparaginase